MTDWKEVDRSLNKLFWKTFIVAGLIAAVLLCILGYVINDLG
jgi:hypothetical protein